MCVPWCDDVPTMWRGKWDSGCCAAFSELEQTHYFFVVIDHAASLAVLPPGSRVLASLLLLLSWVVGPPLASMAQH
jgi:hypothetical protein